MSPLPEGAYAPVPGTDWQIHYHCVGEGAPVLFLHGSGPGASGWSNFRHNAALLAEHGYQCVLADSLGYGHSSKPTDVTYDLATMSGCMVALMEHLGHDRFVIVGNSQGGAQAIRIALDHPGRVEKLVLMAPGGLEARETYMEMKGIRSMMRCIYGPEGITLFGMQKVFEKQLFDPSGLPEGVVADRFAIAQTQPIEVFKNMRVDNQAARLHELTMPVLGLWGVNDLFCPVSGAATLAQHVQNCRVVTFSQCGHWVMVEHADAFNRICLDFLQHG